MFERRRVIAIGGRFRRFARTLAIPCALALATASNAQAPTDSPASVSAQKAEPPSAASVLSVAFANRYDIDAISWVELVIRNGSVDGEETGEDPERWRTQLLRVIALSAMTSQVMAKDGF